MTREQIRAAGRAVLRLLGEYRGYAVRRNERGLDAVFYAYLRGAAYSASRQHRVWMYGSSRPQRIDFRIGGNPRSVIELAVRPPDGRYELGAESNHAELKKLARVKQGEAHMRYLLLIDQSARRGPIPRADLKAEYDLMNAGRGHFTRNPVRVVYAHAEDEYDFHWSPWAG